MAGSSQVTGCRRSKSWPISSAFAGFASRGRASAAQIKVLDVRRGDGTYVRSLEPGDLLSGMVFALELVQACGLDEVLEVRRLLFPPAAGLRPSGTSSNSRRCARSSMSSRSPSTRRGSPNCTDSSKGRGREPGTRG